MSALIFATRPSALARYQTQFVIRLLRKAHPDLDFQEVVIATSGDRNLSQPLPEIGGKGLFTQELEQQLLENKVDVAVHSLKDLPVNLTPGLVIGAIPERADARDAVVSSNSQRLDQLRAGSVVGTSSLRRTAQLLSYRPDLMVKSLRGNVDTRVKKAILGEYDAIILAGAGLQRLGLDNHITEWLPFEMMLPAPGQGALAVECRAEDERVLRILSTIEDASTRIATEAERSFLAALGGGCSLPVAAMARAQDRQISLEGFIGSPDGSRVIRCQAEGDNPNLVGNHCARFAIDQRALEILSVLQLPYQ